MAAKKLPRAVVLTLTRYEKAVRSHAIGGPAIEEPRRQTELEAALGALKEAIRNVLSGRKK